MRRRRDKSSQDKGEVLKGGVASNKTKFAIIKVCDDAHYNSIVTFSAILVLLAFIAEMTAPTAYGKFGDGAVIAVSPRVGWFLMELPVTVTLVYFFFIKGGSQSRETVPRLLALIMCGHYLYRGWYYPYNIIVPPGKTSKFSLITALGGWLYTVFHGYLSAKWFAEYGKHLKNSWLKDLRFWVGLFIYYSGFILLVWHDNIMRNLRSTPGPRYRIPYGGLFEYSASAAYFAELWAWFGFAILSWGPNGVFILLVSLVNLVPRSISNYEWYVEKFGDEFPKDRAYLIPFVW